MSFPLPTPSADPYEALYSELGLHSRDGASRLLHEACPDRHVCWRDASDRTPLAGTSGEISRPYVGEEYGRLRLLALAMNMNEHGGYRALIDLVEYARPALAAGRRRLDFGDPNYAGTIFHHRLGAYAAVLAGVAGALTFSRLDDGFPSGPDVARAFGLLAFTNHVKCSPRGDRSAPTAGMWERCGPRVLAREIELLEPRLVLVLGKGDNAWHLEQHVLGPPSDFAYEDRNVRAFVGRLSGRRIPCIATPHPSARGFRPTEVLASLALAARIVLRA
jgi:hypothetical protein